jgi:hypothetical protein
MTKKEKIKAYQKEYKKVWREKNKEKRKTWRRENKDRIAKYQKNRRQKDPSFKLVGNIRGRQNSVLKGVISSTKGLGCDSKFLKKYIESQFEDGMNWSNYGNKENQWSIDHILPMSLYYNNPELVDKLIHYTNLCPMWSIENSKKGNKQHTEK